MIDDGATSVCTYAAGQLTKLPATLLVTPSAGTGGSISPSTAQSIAYGATASFTVTADSGYSLDQVTGCGGSLVGGAYTTGAITADCTVTASFTADPVNGTCGSAHGQTLTAAPAINLCAAGTPSAVTGSGPWTWTWSCGGANGGTTATCSAEFQAAPAGPSGDLNGDGAVDIADALKALRIAAGIETAAPADLVSGDVAPLGGGMPAPDGVINIGDVVVILRKAVGLVSW